MNNEKIVLVGMMGAGKTTLGKLLARRLGRPFIDVDGIIEAEGGMTIADIFARLGEAEFRRRELATIRRLADRPEPAVLAVGGGAFCQAPVRDFLRGACRSVFIRVPEEELLRRLETAGIAARPMLAGGDWRERVRELARSRYPVYEAATHSLDVGDEPPETTARRILELLGETCGND